MVEKFKQGDIVIWRPGKGPEGQLMKVWGYSSDGFLLIHKPKGVWPSVPRQWVCSLPAMQLQKPISRQNLRGSDVLLDVERSLQAVEGP
jgi:hypothetical protein